MIFILNLNILYIKTYLIKVLKWCHKFTIFNPHDELTIHSIFYFIYGVSSFMDTEYACEVYKLNFLKEFNF